MCKLFQKTYQLRAKQILLREARLPLDDSPHQLPAQCRANLMSNKFKVACAGCNTKSVLMHWGSFDMSAYNVVCKLVLCLLATLPCFTMTHPTAGLGNVLPSAFFAKDRACCICCLSCELTSCASWPAAEGRTTVLQQKGERHKSLNQLVYAFSPAA